MKQQQFFVSVLLTLFLAFVTAKADAQPWYGNIDSLKLLPATPASVDSVKVICYATFPSGVCQLLNAAVLINDTIITVQTDYFVGTYTYICHSTDTITLGGNFAPGNYTVIYNLSDSFPDIIDTDTIFFTIPAATGMNVLSQPESIPVFPNPSSGSISIDLHGQNFETGSVIIRNAVGQIIYSEDELKSEGNQIYQVHLNDLPDGIYLMELTLNNTRSLKKIVKYSIAQ